jgi:hypothetical protein
MADAARCDEESDGVEEDGEQGNGCKMAVRIRHGGEQDA